ncbi:hypothetical protein POL68_05305 [Stigmatella sp. ncwal1]|uniref:Uncharacterized protein n=1 Tax=Stigmatella ashevillensis TaxID=2995309 RepID=A0ABT5D2I7_9BACT|nr:hypothetical protein [Stigmatella ashevillena]MDC0707880.1 hypothetical protein [Stigmatella ashevillena]
MNRRRGGWLALALVLLALGAVLMFTGSAEEPVAEAPRVEFPRRMRHEEWQRAEKRRTQAVAVVDAGVQTAPPLRPRDPLLAALPRGKGRSAVVIETNALRHSPIGELLLDCLMRDGGKDLEKFKQFSGIDPLQDLDRMVITDDGFMLSGDLSKARFKDILQESVSMDYGSDARVYEPGPWALPQPDGGVTRGRLSKSLGLWNNQLLVVGNSPDSVKGVIDQIEGRGSDEPSIISEENTYGEMYGALSVEQLARLLPPEHLELAQRLKDVADTVELHLDARSDVAMVAQVRGGDEEKVRDLGKSLGGVLSMARLKAQAEGEEDLARLLDFANVKPEGSEFKMEIAVPFPLLQERLAACREGKPVEENVGTRP